MIESGAGESSDKEYSDGAEVTKDTAKVFCPMILKVGPPTLAEIAMMNNSSSQSKTMQKVLKP
jgi:alanine dehydrogenase